MPVSIRRVRVGLRTAQRARGGDELRGYGIDGNSTGCGYVDVRGNDGGHRRGLRDSPANPLPTISIRRSFHVRRASRSGDGGGTRDRRRYLGCCVGVRGVDTFGSPGQRPAGWAVGAERPELFSLHDAPLARTYRHPRSNEPNPLLKNRKQDAARGIEADGKVVLVGRIITHTFPDRWPRQARVSREGFRFIGELPRTRRLIVRWSKGPAARRVGRQGAFTSSLVAHDHRGARRRKEKQLIQDAHSQRPVTLAPNDAVYKSLGGAYILPACCRRDGLPAPGTCASF